MTNDNFKTVKRNSLRAWWLAARPKTLTGAAVPVMIGTALAYTDAYFYNGNVFSWTAAVLCMAFAFVMQIDANFVNDFFDFAKGRDDAATRLGPPRACAQGWVTLDAMKRAIAFTTCTACIVGLPLIIYGGWGLVIVGLVCVIGCFAYTTHLAARGWGDGLVVIFFGIVPVCITYYVQLHTCTLQVLIASIACGLVIDGLLVVNNYRDRDIDQQTGKNTLVVRLGEKRSEQLYLMLGITATAMGLVFWANNHVIAFALPFIYLVLHVSTYLKMCRINKGKALNECLGETARNIFIYGLCTALGILLI